MIVVGLDLSLTATGIATITDGEYRTTTVTPKKLTGHDRLAWIEESVKRVTADADLVVTEGPAFGAQGSAYHQLAGLWWLITHSLWHDNRPLAIASPSNLKQYATGKGGASKEAVLIQVVRRFPAFDGDNNAADALILAALGADHLGHPIVDMPQAHRVALDGVQWPAP